MIHHFSMAANNPQHVSEVLAELVGGSSFPFPPYPGAFIVVVEDGRGSAIEVLPVGARHTISQTHEGCEYTFQPETTDFGPVHALISTPLSPSAVTDIAKRERWHTQPCSRGGYFDLIEVWVENHLMLEVACPEHLDRYLDAMTYSSWGSRGDSGSKIN